jgi:hypothetical protein
MPVTVPLPSLFCSYFSNNFVLLCIKYDENSKEC